eukprot:g33065.t1
MIRRQSIRNSSRDTARALLAVLLVGLLSHTSVVADKKKSDGKKSDAKPAASKSKAKKSIAAEPADAEPRVPNRPKVPGRMKFHLRSRVETAKGSGKVKAVTRVAEWETAKTVIIICDMWNGHYCKSSAQRVDAMAPKMNRVITAARNHGVMIIHAPSGTLSHPEYNSSPYRKRMQQARKFEPPIKLKRWCYLDRDKEHPLPIDDSKSPCDDPVVGPRVRKFTKQHDAIKIIGYDGISDSGDEIYNFMRQEGINNVVIMGVHTNMCVLGRPFGIRQMVTLGMNVTLSGAVFVTDHPPQDFETVVDDILSEFESRCRDNRPPPLDEFSAQVARLSAPWRGEVIRELTKIDLEYFWKSRRQRSDDDSSPTVRLIEDCLDALPVDDAEALITEDLIRHEYLVRHWWGDTPEHEEYFQRFPAQADRLRKILREADAGLSASRAQSDQAEPPGGADGAAASEDGAQSSAVIGDYELLEEIASGGMGVVYKARQISLNRIVALKMIRSGEFAGEHEIRRFKVEAEAAARLDHPHIVPIFEVGEQARQHYFSMSYIEGGTLSTLLSHGPLQPRMAAELVGKVAGAVQYAHERGIIHRDLKPGNILLQNDAPADVPSATSTVLEPTETVDISKSKSATEAESATDDAEVADSASNESTQTNARTQRSSFGADEATQDVSSGATWIPKVADFGLAKRTEPGSEMTTHGRAIGTPEYMPPEQAQGRIDDIGPQSDVYSLGAVLYCAVTGRPPFRAATPIETMRQLCENEPISPRKLNPAVDRDLETICLKCLEKQPAKRYASARELADDLERFLDGRSISARPENLLRRGWRWCRRKPAWAAFAASVVVLILTLAIGGPTIAVREAGLRKDAEVARESAQESEQRAKDSERRARMQRDVAERAGGVSNDTIDVTLQLLSESEIRGNPKLRQQLNRHANRMLQISLALVDELRGQPDRTLEYAKYLFLAGRIRIVLNRHNVAEGHFQEAVKALNDYSPENNTEREERENLAATARFHLAELQRILGKRDLAITTHLDALRIRQQLTRGRSLTLDEKRDIGLAHHRLGRIHQELQLVPKALEHYRSALELRQELVNADPKNAEDLRLLATTINNVAILYSAQNRNAEAESMYRRLLAITETLHRQFPDNADYQVRHGESHHNLAQFYRGLRDNKQALENFQAAKNLIRPVVERLPLDGGFRLAMRNLHSGIAQLMQQIPDRKQDAIPHWIESLRMNDVPGRDQFTRWFAVTASLLQARKAAAENMQPEELFQAARLSATAAGVLAESKLVSAAQRDAQASPHIAETFRFLRLAFETGYFNEPANRKAFLADPEFDIIRRHTEYPTLVQQILNH